MLLNIFASNAKLTKSFPWQDFSLTIPSKLSNSLTFPGFPDKWLPCYRIKCCLMFSAMVRCVFWISNVAWGPLIDTYASVLCNTVVSSTCKTPNNYVYYTLYIRNHFTVSAGKIIIKIRTHTVQNKWQNWISSRKFNLTPGLKIIYFTALGIHTGHNLTSS